MYFLLFLPIGMYVFLMQVRKNDIIIISVVECDIPHLFVNMSQSRIILVVFS